MSKNNKNFTSAEDIKAWEDFKNQKFLDGDKGEVSKKSIKGKKKQDHIDFKIDLHGYSLQESFEKIRGSCRKLLSERFKKYFNYHRQRLKIQG
jgi:hypothetical protein